MAKYDGEIYSVEIKNYSKYILIRSTTEEYMLKHINDYGDLFGGEKILYEFKYYTITKCNNMEWIIIKCPNDFPFYNFHNLTAWFDGIQKEDHRPDFIAGIAYQNTDVLDNYYTMLDEENPYGDTFIGVFDDGKKFSIALPDAYIEGGNIRIGYNNMKIIGVSNYLESLELNNEDLRQIDNKECKTVSVEMVFE